MPRTVDLDGIVRPEHLATQIVNKYVEWETARAQWMDEKQEIRDYLFATDTRGTTNDTLPWKNSVHVPKLCQIRDNLNANYMGALFPNDRPIAWEGEDRSSNTQKKRLMIESYMYTKMRLGKFRNEVQKCVNDFIDYGNAFAMTEYVAEEWEDPITGEKHPGYVGPRMVRISPWDIVFDPTAATFEEAPKILRTIRSLGSIIAEMEDNPESGYLQEALDKCRDLRKHVSTIGPGDIKKNKSFQMDGFGSYLNYLQSDSIEFLDFYGNIYDTETGEYYKNYLCTVIDRAYIIRKTPLNNWGGHPPIFHVGWRLRPDNLYAMGPLDNLVGMQYRIDHLENAKADAFDLIIHPVMKITGAVEDFEYGPGERIYTSEGDVAFMSPDVTMLQADTQIAMYEAKMEEMAGAPKQAMGFRTPGEKTKYEVQVLENGANRVFLNKTSYFEEMFLEPILNSMLETARRNMGPSDTAQHTDDQFGAIQFMTITKDDLVAKGKITAVGARRFARNANIIQNLTNLSNSPIGQDPGVTAHISGKQLAKLMEELLDLNRFELVKDNIRIAELMETEQLKQSAQQLVMERNMPDNANAMVPAPQGPGQTGPV